MLFAFTACAGVGSVLGGTLADRIGRWQLMALALTLLAPASWVLLQVPMALQILVVGVMGVLVGANFPVAIIAAQESWPAGPGLATGMALGLAWIGSGLGGLLTGRMVDQVSAAFALRWLFVPALLALVCVLVYPLVRRPRTPPA
jgi:FSR family fosmidomycin resistance protein-like MFS transporter